MGWIVIMGIRMVFIMVTMVVCLWVVVVAVCVVWPEEVADGDQDNHSNEVARNGLFQCLGHAVANTDAD